MAGSSWRFELANGLRHILKMADVLELDFLRVDSARGVYDLVERGWWPDFVDVDVLPEMD